MAPADPPPEKFNPDPGTKPGRDGRPQARLNASVRNTFPWLLAPRSPAAQRPPPPLLPPRDAAGAAPRRCPGSPPYCARGRAGAAAPSNPQRPRLPLSFCLTSPFEIPSGAVTSEEPAASFETGRKRSNRCAPYRSAVPGRRATGSFSFPAPPRRQQRGEEAEQAGQPRASRAAGRREEGGLAASASLALRGGRLLRRGCAPLLPSRLQLRAAVAALTGQHYCPSRPPPPPGRRGHPAGGSGPAVGTRQKRRPTAAGAGGAGLGRLGREEGWACQGV